MASPGPDPAAFTLFTGPILAGTQFNWALFGILSVQIYIFYSSFPKETIGMKALVYGIYIIEIVQTALSSHFAFAVLVNGWGDPNAIQKLPWSISSIPITAAIVSPIVQLFLAWRIYLLSSRSRYTWPVCAVIAGVALMQSIAAVISGSLFAQTSNPHEFELVQTPVRIWLIGSAVCDVLISATMILILSHYRKKTPWKKTDTIIAKLIYHTIETGAVTAFVAVVEVVFFIVYNANFLHLVPAFMLGKMYSNVMMATLNARGRSTRSTGLSASGGQLSSSRDTDSHGGYAHQAHQLKIMPRQTARNQQPGREVQVSKVTEITDDFGGKISIP
ncbi:hypothetical protein C8R44DRAFT_755795 [Mycena epipterygia]|nr:hypothetical protein C8R44DRAFT_755795 [Mycena epipterygia]